MAANQILPYNQRVNELDGRAKKVLNAVVSEYLETGFAVGSQTIARRYNLDVSAATIRTVMGDLEDQGMLRHPHASAGRVPTERGLRYYVDTLLRVRKLTELERSGIREQLQSSGDVNEMMHRATQVLRELSHLTVVVQAPRVQDEKLVALEFVRLRDDQLLAVLATESGQIQNKAIDLTIPLAPNELEPINNYLRELVVGLTMSEVQVRVRHELDSDRTQHDRIRSRALFLAAAAVPERTETPLIVEGQSHLLDSADNMDAARTLLRGIEEKEFIVRLLDETLRAPGIRVFIGAEASLADHTDISVVTASYGGDEKPLGTIGVIGPSRINYSKVISLVDFTADMIGNALPKR